MAENASRNDSPNEEVSSIMSATTQTPESTQNMLFLIPVLPRPEELESITENASSVTPNDLGIVTFVGPEALNFSTVESSSGASNGRSEQHDFQEMVTEPCGSAATCMWVNPRVIPGVSPSILATSQPTEINVFNTIGELTTSPSPIPIPSIAQLKQVLEKELLCHYCYTGLLNSHVPMLFYTRLFKARCKLCGYKTRMKDYQQLCFACSRRRNVCIKCITFSVVLEEENIFNFENLLIGEAAQIFNNMSYKIQYKIVKKVYLTYDSFVTKQDSVDNATIIFQNLLDKYK